MSERESMCACGQPTSAHYHRWYGPLPRYRLSRMGGSGRIVTITAGPWTVTA